MFELTAKNTTEMLLFFFRQDDKETVEKIITLDETDGFPGESLYPVNDEEFISEEEIKELVYSNFHLRKIHFIKCICSLLLGSYDGFIYVKSGVDIEPYLTKDDDDITIIQDKNKALNLFYEHISKK